MKKSNKKSGLADSPFFPVENEKGSGGEIGVVAIVSKSEEKQRNPTLESTSVITHARDTSREDSRADLRARTRHLSARYPQRDEIQVFNFQLRDALKVKVQAEVPHEWQRELEEIAHTLGIKKMELYRFIYGEFLGKVKRKG